MKLCAQCNDNIPYRVLIDGKIRNTQHRKYCLVCSPFGQGGIHEKGKRKSSVKTCIACGKPSSKCKLCGSCVVRRARIRRKLKAVELKGGKCEICEYDKNIAALVFHHEDPAIKEFHMSGGNQSWERTLKELDKCQLLCVRCHTEHHHPEMFVDIVKATV